jgi:hypothetical protein
LVDGWMVEGLSGRTSVYRIRVEIGITVRMIIPIFLSQTNAFLSFVCGDWAELSSLLSV